LFGADKAPPRPTEDTLGSAPAARSIPDPAKDKEKAKTAAPVENPAGAKTDAERPPIPSLSGAKTRVVVIPVREQVDSPLLFIIRRGLKEAIEKKADLVVLDMKTPGGELGVTFEIMEALAKFPGQTLTFINSEALSAGAFISATTEEIWFSPDGVIGAAAPVLSTGGEIDVSMKQKVVSYLKARVRSISEGKTHRGKVISAMIDADYELKIDDKVLKGKGELLSLTAKEAAERYGTPPEPLLASGIAKSVTELLTKKFGADNYSVTTLEVTWSEHFAVFLRGLAPILMGLGLLAIYIEFKTPGFGFFGIAGITCLAIVFLSNYVAGLSGHEPMLVFLLGLALVFVEIFLMPGVLIFAMAGLALMAGSLVWSMADVWPNEPISFTGDLFVQPLISLGLGLLTAVVLALLLARFIPKGWFFTRLAVTSPIAGAAQIGGSAPEVGAEAGGVVGRVGIAATGLYPSGQVEVDGRRYEARLEVGSARPGARIVVRRRTDFGLIVELLEGEA
ncbi:MAG TPA: hypothetical protein VGE76_08860, partial [Opitutaceae bacterium]